MNKFEEKSIASYHIPTSLCSVNASIRPASVCIYARLAGAGGREGGGEVGAARGKPLCDIIPHARSPGRFVSLADFCRLTSKHPWTLPPPFTFNLYQSIQPKPNRKHECARTGDVTLCGRHRALFTADSVFTLATSVHLFHRVPFSPPSSSHEPFVAFCTLYSKHLLFDSCFS